MNKVYVDINDYYRALITDTLPFETPIIFSNDGLYLLLKDGVLSKTDPFSKFISNILTYKHKTEPYKYYIPKGDSDSRVISLVHPASQFEMSKFLCENSDLIIYFCTKSPASLRFPKKLSSKFYLKDKDSENLYKYRDGSKSTIKKDYLSLYSPSLFVYKDFDRLYKFIDSSMFLELESNYPYLRTVDISKCFHNIYTHSISWAIKNKEIIKNSLQDTPNHFADTFDKKIRLGNYDETHGIPIGAEYSRIFSEIIFQRIDNNIIESLNKEGFTYGENYIFKRYIDDIYIFATSDSILDTLQECIKRELISYNLHINHGKVVSYHRPFVTNKGIAFQRISQVIDWLEISISKKVLKHDKLKNSFIRKVKSIVHENNVNFTDINNFLISSISNRIKSYIKTNKDEDFDYKVVGILFDINFFFFHMASNANISYIICKDILYIIENLKDSFGLLLNIYNLISSFIYKKNGKSFNLERLNMILITKSFPIQLHFESDSICNLLLHEDASYFDIIVAIFYSKNNTISEEKIVNYIINKFKSKSYGGIHSSEDVHLILDLMSCPYISRKNKKKIYNDANLSKFFPCRVIPGDTFFNEAEKHHIFTKWGEFSIYNFLFKKEIQRKLLKTVY